MSSPRRLTAPVAALFCLVLVACGASVAPSSTGSPTAASASAGTSGDDVARTAYSTAICHIFTGILQLDPRLAAMRSAGAAGGDMTAHTEEIGALTHELRALLEELDGVPDWQPGAPLRLQLITALHGIRAELLHVGGDPAAADAAANLAELPFIATDAMDRAMGEARRGGLTCESTS